MCAWILLRKGLSLCKIWLCLRKEKQSYKEEGAEFALPRSDQVPENPAIDWVNPNKDIVTLAFELNFR